MTSTFERAGGRRSFVAAALALCAAASFAQVPTAPYAAKPLHILVPFPPGGTADVLARVIGQHITETTGQAVIVDNKGGAGGTIGMDAAKRSPADGYNVVMISNSQAGSQVLYPKLSHDIIRDFEPIVMIASSPMVIAASTASGLKNLAMVLDRAQREPERLTYASCGIGTSHHLAMEKIKFDAGRNLLHVSYRGCAPAVTDAVAGQIDLVIASSPLILPQVAAGKLVALAVTSGSRSALAPDIPTVSESGVAALARFSMDNWYALMAPLGTPAAAAAQIDAAVRQAMASPQTLQRLAQVGIEPKPGSAADVTRLLKSDLVQFKTTIDHAHITVE